VVARMVGIMDGRAIFRMVAFAHSQIIGDRDRLAVGDQEPVEWPCLGRPGPHARRSAGVAQEDCGARTRFLAMAVGRQRLLMGAPTEFGGLAALADETVDRP